MFSLRLKIETKAYVPFFGKYADKTVLFLNFSDFFSSAVFITTHRKITVLETRWVQNSKEQEPFHDLSKSMFYDSFWIIVREEGEKSKTETIISN